MTVPTRDGPPRRSTVRLQAGLLLLMVALIGLGVLVGTLRHRGGPPAAAQAPAATPQAYQLLGSVTAPSGDGSCRAAPRDVTEGAPVAVLDANGRQIAESRLGPGRRDTSGVCIWSYQVALPPADVYLLQVASLPAVQATRQALTTQGWRYTQPDD